MSEQTRKKYLQELEQRLQGVEQDLAGEIAGGDDPDGMDLTPEDIARITAAMNALTPADFAVWRAQLDRAA